MLRCELFTAQNGKEAFAILEQESIDLIICDFNMPLMNGGEVYQAIIKHNIPVRFVLCSTDSMLNHDAFKDQSAFYGLVQKPNIIQGLNTIINNFKTEIIERKIDVPDEYTEIGLHFLLNLSMIPVDIFLKITKDKFVKAYRRGDIFDQTDFVKLYNKGLHFLYSLKTDSNKLIGAMSDKIKDLKISQKDPISLQFEINDLIRHSFQSYGVQAEIVNETLFLIQDTLELFNRDRSLGLLIEKILNRKHNYIGKHSFLLAGISCFIAKHMSWISDLTQSKLVTVSLLHDVFLTEADLHIDGSGLRESEIVQKRVGSESFISHPARSAELISRIAALPPDCSSIILEQHEVGDASGIPHHLNWSKISPLGQLFTFSHFVVDRMLNLQENSNLNQQNLMQALDELENKSSNYRKFFEVLKNHSLFE
jgi:response regulator RpfG family c-di-GMP phosphodiesterase